MFEQLPLKDIHLPGPVSWWPPAPGWWLLAGLLVLAAIGFPYLAAAARRLRKRRRVRRQALDELARIERDLDSTGDLPSALQNLSILLRRVALSVFPERKVAGRAGREWSEWLQRTGPEGLDPAVLESLARAPYRPESDVPGPSALSVARQWIEHVTRRAGRASA